MSSSSQTCDRNVPSACVMFVPVSCALLSFSQAYGPERQTISILHLQIGFMSLWLINRNGPISLTLTPESGADLRLRCLCPRARTRESLAHDRQSDNQDQQSTH